MADAAPSTKRLAISKANAQMVAVVAVASFITVFCLVAAKAVWSQTRYQSRVTSASEKAHQQLKQNITAFGSLQQSYRQFNSGTTNLIGGSTAGDGPNSGTNAQIVIDALPSKYDFPALTSSIEKILNAGNFDVSSITGTDEQLSEQGNSTSPNPSAVSMPFSFSITNANYGSVQQLIDMLQASIRPIQIDSMTLTGGASNMTVTVNAETYYQPGKSLNITKQVIK